MLMWTNVRWQVGQDRRSGQDSRHYTRPVAKVGVHRRAAAGAKEVFSAKLYGSRSHESKRLLDALANDGDQTVIETARQLSLIG